MIYNWKDMIMRSPATVQTANKLFTKYYCNRGESLPERTTKKHQNLGLMLREVRQRGKVKAGVACLDYKNFYPNIIKGLKLNPRDDKLQAYQSVLRSLLKSKPNDKIKSFLVKFCNGWLNCEDFCFMDSDMHYDMLSYSYNIMKETIKIVDNNSKFKVLMINTDGFHVQLLEHKNLHKHFNDLAKEINEKIGKDFINIRVKGVFTYCFIGEPHGFHQPYFCYNEYTKEYQFSAMEEWGYNLRLKGILK